MPAQQRSFYQQTDLKGQEIGKLTDERLLCAHGRLCFRLHGHSRRHHPGRTHRRRNGHLAQSRTRQAFPRPVKYVIYSHSHWDHASGGSVYADTARFIGHENMLKNIAMPPANTPLPANVRAQDTNGNGTIEPSEAQGNLKTMFSMYDANKDGVAERRRDRARPPAIRQRSRHHLHRSHQHQPRRQARRSDPHANGSRRRQHHRALHRRQQRALRLRLDHRSPPPLRSHHARTKWTT